MKKTLPLLIVSAGVALLLGGCAEGPELPVANVHSPETAGAPVVLLDEDMRDDVAVDQIQAGRNQNNFLTVQASLRNRTDHDFAIQIQTLFYDANGNVLYAEPGQQPGWTIVPLTSAITLPYRAQALSLAAAKFTIRVRYLNRHRD